jgi:hypothetical protein
LLEITTLRDLPRPYTIKMKRKGERESPCRIPHEVKKVDVGDPFTKIENKVEEVGDIIHLIQRGDNQKL